VAGTRADVALVYTLDGTDDLCGAPQAASVVGIAFQNPNASIGFISPRRR